MIKKIRNAIIFDIYRQAVQGKHYYHCLDISPKEINPIKKYFIKQGYTIKTYKNNKDTYDIYFYW